MSRYPSRTVARNQITRTYFAAIVAGMIGANEGPFKWNSPMIARMSKMPGDELRARKRMRSKTNAFRDVRTGHEQIDAVIHDNHDFAMVDRKQGDFPMKHMPTSARSEEKFVFKKIQPNAVIRQRYIVTGPRPPLPAGRSDGEK